MKQILKSKKGMGLGEMYPAVLLLVLVGIVLGIGLYILVEISDQIASGSVAGAQAINTTVTGLGGLATWIAVIVVVIAAAIVLGIVISSFGSQRGV